MRLFAAIDLTDEARRAIAAENAAIVASLGDRGHGLKLVRPEHMHLTLAFVGDATDTVGASIIAGMQRPIAQAPFAIVFGGLGTFPPKGAPRILWLGMIQGREAAAALQESVARRFRDAGAILDSRPFKPHLTLGRWRVPSRSWPPQELVCRERVAAVDVASVTLYQSRLSSSGPTYSRLATTDLTCP
jgi:2'-5' RNA ligase